MDLWGFHDKRPIMVNSLAPGRYGSNFENVSWRHMLQMKFMSSSGELALRWMPQNTFDDKSILAQVMAWCRQATSHYLSQCWPRSVSCVVTRPQWISYMMASVSSDQADQLIPEYNSQNKWIEKNTSFWNMLFKAFSSQSWKYFGCFFKLSSYI